MKGRTVLLFLPVLGIATIVALVTLSLTPAYSHPGYSNECSGCHGANGAVGTSVNKQSETGTQVTYAVSGANANQANTGWGVFDGSGTKVAGGSGSGQFTVPKDGANYKVYWVNKTGSNQGYNVANVAAPASGSTATTPTTTCSTVTPTASPNASASAHDSAMDDTDGMDDMDDEEDEDGHK